jgi:hypothetical protein
MLACIDREKYRENISVTGLQLYIYIYIYIYTSIYIYIYTHTHIHTYIHTYIHKHIHTYVYIILSMPACVDSEKYRDNISVTGLL